MGLLLVTTASIVLQLSNCNYTDPLGEGVFCELCEEELWLN